MVSWSCRATTNAIASAMPMIRIQSSRRRTEIVLSAGDGGGPSVHDVEPGRQLGHNAGALVVTVRGPALDLDKAAPAAAAEPGRRINQANLLAGCIDQ